MANSNMKTLHSLEGIGKIQFEGKQSKNPLAFKHYDPSEMIGGKTMKDYLRFSVAYWHTLTADGTDMFGTGTMQRAWDSYSGMDLAKARLEVAFQLFDLLDVPYFSFHDRDIAPEGDTLQETNQQLDIILERMKEYMRDSGVKLLWNTANMFKHPRFVHGAATSCHADVFAYAAAQVKKGIDTAKELGAENYVFWGGREGYDTLLNTDMKRELDHMASFLHMAVDYAKEIGYTGQFLIEPKPKEPTTHQYDADAATSIAFLKQYGLDSHFKLNIEANHATLAGHTFEHELRVSRIHGLLGSVDANQGNTLLGWDTDEFPTDLYATTLAMYEILQNGGLGTGGLNFDAKVRRASFELEDILYAHIAGMDAFAKGLRVAHRLIEDRVFEDVIKHRYRSFSEGIGRDISEGKANFHTLEEYALKHPLISNESGREEQLKARLNQYLLED
ncbi:xylose isomerase [Bacillus pumilus]|uniref:xylose isomerase n=1 Tax=Bacillus pumilus TaxID=1408 RepID=UPI0022822D7E|nr:xylose isomerase [Bacillus pumilus]MCY7500350.1 xylose isomerase [Bacillus pumilus]MCY7528328.1 xylose isomerase [Bacillus pumilus]MED4441398.1 xylose isomerase [Bacillus pumilus]MED4492653.1 xylose isomerase [Bacillus pumilus]